MRSVYFVQGKYPANPIELNNLLERWNYYGLRLDQLTGTGYITIISPFGVPALEKEFLNLRFSVARKLLNIREVAWQFITAANKA